VFKKKKKRNKDKVMESERHTDCRGRRGQNEISKQGWFECSKKKTRKNPPPNHEILEDFYPASHEKNFEVRLNVQGGYKDAGTQSMTTGVGGGRFLADLNCLGHEPENKKSPRCFPEQGPPGKAGIDSNNRKWRSVIHKIVEFLSRGQKSNHNGNLTDQTELGIPPPSKYWVRADGDRCKEDWWAREKKRKEKNTKHSIKLSVVEAHVEKFLRPIVRKFGTRGGVRKIETTGTQQTNTQIIR